MEYHSTRESFLFCFYFKHVAWKRSHGKMSWNDLNEVSQQTEKIMPWTVRHSLSLKYGAPNGIALFG